MLIENPWTQLRELTAARIALGRAGHSLPTRELLAFQLAHARARDAVWRGLEAASLISASLISKTLAPMSPLHLHSAARDRAEYLRRPDLGRKLAPESAERIERGEWDAAIVIADGLSAIAVHRHAGALLDALLPQLDGWRIARVCLVEQGRVAIGDDIGERMGAAMALVILGERPGLSSPDSLGAYLTWSPRVGRTDAERNCVSNIRAGGLDPEIASVRIAQLMQAARSRQLTGVGLSIEPALEWGGTAHAGEACAADLGSHEDNPA
jgi:ethanolamine ammonia-lyase small subunit